MRYFNEFPVIDYNLTGVNGNSKKVTDIFRRIKVRCNWNLHIIRFFLLRNLK